MAPTLFFSVGATKAGTSWLHSYLQDHPECHLRGIKELHYFDTLNLGRNRVRMETLERARLKLEARLVHAGPEKIEELRGQIATRLEWEAVMAGAGGDPAAYLGYLTAGIGPAHRLVADMTPAYALLGEDQLSEMARLMPDTRFLYLMRDPLARLWSHVRMIAARKSASGRAEPDEAARLLARVIDGAEPGIERRGDYRGAVGRLRSSVAPGRLKLMFYEDMFSQAGMAELCGFLGLSYKAPDAERVVHAGPALEIGEDEARAARDWLEPQYEFVRAQVGAPPAAWQDQMQKV